MYTFNCGFGNNHILLIQSIIIIIQYIKRIKEHIKSAIITVYHTIWQFFTIKCKLYFCSLESLKQHFCDKAVLYDILLKRYPIIKNYCHMMTSATMYLCE